MKWNYRLVKFTHEGEPVVALREVFYNEMDEATGHSEPFLWSETEQGARELMDTVMEDVKQPTLEWNEPEELSDLEVKKLVMTIVQTRKMEGGGT